MTKLGAEKQDYDGPLSARQLVVILVVLGVIVAAIVFVPQAVRSAQHDNAGQQQTDQQLRQLICTPPVPAGADCP